MYIFNDGGIVEDMLRNKNIPGGCYILRGTKGLGKRKAAEQMAGAVLDAQWIVSHPDYFLVEPKDGVIGMEQVRELKSFVSYIPVAAERKVIIIDDADKMSLSAQNAVLKILEEETESNLFLLVAHEDLLPTIASRSVRIDFQPLQDSDMRKIFPEGEDECLFALAAGRPGIYQVFLSDEAFLKDVHRILSVFSNMKNKREILEAFHLTKEKDKANFYERYDAVKVQSFLKIVEENVFLQALVKSTSDVCDTEHIRKMYSTEQMLRIIQSLQKALGFMRKKGAFNKNDFFEMIRTML